MTPLLADQQQRTEALNPRKSFIVQAPAGSGKTGLLVRRFLSLLSTVTNPEEILAITFTRKATAEMSDRILSALNQAEQISSDGEQNEEMLTLAQKAIQRDQELGWNLRMNPGRLRIQTIDSLCYELVRSMPWSARFGAAPTILESGQAKDYYQEASRKALNHIEEKDENANHIGTILQLLNAQFSRSQALLSHMLEKRDLWLRGVTKNSRGKFEAMWRAVVESELETLSRSVELSTTASFRLKLIRLLSIAKQNLETEGKQTSLSSCIEFPTANIDDLDCWKSLASFLLTEQSGKFKCRKVVNKNNGFPKENKEHKAEMEALLRDLAENPATVTALAKVPLLPNPAFSDEQWRVLEALLNVLPMAAAELRLLFTESNCADYTEITQRAEMALTSGDAPSELAMVMDYRLTHLLMDEVQDTSKAHLDIISGLVREWQQGDGKTLFFVGDPMQSIYRFREANVANFLEIQNKGIGGVEPESLTLETNFRSSPNLVNWFNRTFDIVFPDDNDIINAAIRYSPSSSNNDSSHPTIDKPAVTINSFFNEEAEAEALALQIQSAVKNNPDSSIGVLGRSRRHLSVVAQSLRQQCVPFQATELESLHGRPAIQDLFALTRALLHLGDRIAWLSLLRGPWCGLCLKDITTIAEENPNATIQWLAIDALERNILSTDGQQRLTILFERLSKPLSLSRRSPTRDIVQSAWIKLGGPACVDEYELVDCEAFFQLLDDIEFDKGIITADNLSEALTQLWSQTDVQAQVQLLTIHKAKGLEFDFVFLPFLDRWSGQPSIDLLRWAKIGPNLLTATLSPSDEKGDIFNAFLRNLERTQQKNENCRLLYVACTRARKQLNLFAQLKTDEADQVKSPDSRSLLLLLWPALESDFATSLATNQQSIIDAGTDIEPIPLHRIPLGWEPALTPQQITDINVKSAETQMPVESIEFSWASETLRITGIAIHQVLQFAGNHWELWKQESNETQISRIQSLLLEHGLSGDQLAHANTHINLALNNIKSDPKTDWVFSDNHTQIKTEWALTGMTSGKATNIIIDRSFIDEQGTRWIIDFKSSRHEGDDLDLFFQNEQNRYANTMRTYGKIVQLLGNEPIKLGLYFPLLKGWSEWAHDR